MLQAGPARSRHACAVGGSPKAIFLAHDRDKITRVRTMLRAPCPIRRSSVAAGLPAAQISTARSSSKIGKPAAQTRERLQQRQHLGVEISEKRFDDVCPAEPSFGGRIGSACNRLAASAWLRPALAAGHGNARWEV